MGANHTVKVATRDSRELAKQIVDTLGCNPDRTIECSGAAPSIATAIYVSTMVAKLAGIKIAEQCEVLLLFTSRFSMQYKKILRCLVCIHYLVKAVMLLSFNQRFCCTAYHNNIT